MKYMDPPNSRKYVRKFTGLVNYYHNIWARPSYMLAPLTNIISSKVKIKWTLLKQDVFEEIEQIVACDNISTHPYFN